MSQPDGANLHAAIHCLAHVINGKGGNRDSSHRFHLDASAPGNRACCGDPYTRQGVIKLQVHRDMVKAKRVA